MWKYLCKSQAKQYHSPYTWGFHSTTFIDQCNSKAFYFYILIRQYTSTADSTTNIANLVNALLDQTSGEPATAQIKNVISISDGIPLGAATQQRVKTKIWANQFIDLNILLQQREEPLSLRFQQSL